MPPDPTSQAHNHDGEHDHLQKLGKYQIQKKLGAGGMGTVFLAVDTDLKRTVALKVLAKERAENPILVKRFKAEAQSAAQLTHPNIVSVYEAGQADGFLFIALEYVDGIDTLELLRKRGIVPVKRSIDIIKQTCQALQHAYEKGIVHRDIKPSNLMIRQDGTVKLADMGLARSVDDTVDTNITRAGTTVGTVDYMSPEQARDSRAADIRSDIYSLGCTWYHLLTGVIPYPEGSLTNKLQAHAAGKIPDPRSRNPNVPEGVVAVIRRMMAKKKEERYASPAELIKDLENTALGRSTVSADVLAGLAEEAHSPVSAVAPETVYTESDSSTSEMESRRSGASSAIADPPPKSKFKKGGKHSQVRNPTPTRGGGDPKPAKNPSSSSGTAKTLPPRTLRETPVGDDDDKSSGGINPDHIKYAILGVLVVGIIGVVYWAIKSTSDSMGGGGALPVQAQEDEGDNGPDLVPQQGAQGNDGTVDTQPGSEPSLTEFQTQGGPDIPAGITSQETGPLPEFSGTDHLDEGDRGIWLPAWSSDLLNDERLVDLPVLVVSDQPRPGEYRSVEAAMRQVPQTGGIIEFAGAGPFVMDPISIQDKGLVMLRGQPGSRPLINRAASRDASDPWIKITNGLLLVEGVDLLCFIGGGTSPAVIQANESRVRMRDCTITVAGATESGTAIELSSNEQRRVECALERVVIRGDHLTAVSLGGPRVDLLVGNSLLWSGKSPCLRLKGSAASVTAPADVPTRGIRVLATTCCSETQGIAIDNEGINRPAGFELKLLRSVFAHLGDQPGLWADVVGWPLIEASEVTKPRMSQVSIAVESVRLVGWESLLRCTSPGLPEPIAVNDAAGWQQFWRVHASGNEFTSEIPTPAPTTGTEDVIPAVGVWLSSLNEEIGARLMTIGGDHNEWPHASQGLIARTVAVSAWPYVEDDINSGWQASVTREFNLEEDGERLNRFLNGPDCPDGAHVIAYGAGLQQIEWLEISGKRIRLQFVQRGESPLIIQPKPGSVAADRTAWITIRDGGTLELVGGYLKLPATSNRNFPRRLLLADGGRFAIRNCILEGAVVGEDLPTEPLVVWTSDDSSDGPVASSLIEGSMLFSPVTPLQVGLGHRQLTLRNTVVTGLSNGVSLSVPAGYSAWLVIEHCTLAPSAECLAIALGQGSDGVVNIWANESVFGPPLQSEFAPDTIKLEADPGDESRVIWWEDRCGYSDRRQGGIAGVGWDPLRGEGHALRFAEGVRAVLMAATLPEPRDLTPQSFQLDGSCDAAGWGREGGSIGANVDTVGPQAASTPAEVDTTPRPRPDF